MLLLSADEQYQFHPNDQRVGHWTVMSLEADRVTFTLRFHQWTGLWLGGAALLLLLLGMVARKWFPWHPLTALLLAIVGLFFLYRFWLEIPLYGKRPMVTIYDTGAVVQANENDFPSDLIAGVYLRENADRTFDDAAMWQVYLLRQDRPRGVLVYQEPLTAEGRERAFAVSRALADRWGCELRQASRVVDGSKAS